MFSRVVSSGCLPVVMAYCSAGSPKASYPMGCRTLKPSIRLRRVTMSDPMYPMGCPTWSPDPEG